MTDHRTLIILECSSKYKTAALISVSVVQTSYLLRRLSNTVCFHALHALVNCTFRRASIAGLADPSYFHCYSLRFSLCSGIQLVQEQQKPLEYSVSCLYLRPKHFVAVLLACCSENATRAAGAAFSCFSDCLDPAHGSPCHPPAQV